VSPVAVFALIAGGEGLNRRARAASVCMARLSSSSLLVHLRGGHVEAHLHFFVTVTLLATNEKWFERCDARDPEWTAARARTERGGRCHRHRSAVPVTACVGDRADVLVARQPILDSGLEVAGYELLFRTPAGAGAPIEDPERATSHVIVDAIGDIGLDRLAGAHPAYVNVSRALLLAVRPLPLPPDRVVLELLEDQTVDAEFVAVARELAAAGFTLALDDFVYQPALEPLLDFAHIVKVDVLALGREAALDQLQHVRGRSLRLLAEKVETHEDFAFYRDAGFDLFQGFFYARPQLVRARGVPAARLDSVGTLAELQRAGESFERLEAVIRHDAGLSFKLLRFANSAFNSGRFPVGSVREALVRLGARAVHQWATVLALAAIPNRPPELLTTGLLRARTCQILVSQSGDGCAERAFVVGLFSVLDALLDVPMDEVLELLSLEPAVSQALRTRSGAEGAALAAVIAYEHGAAAPEGEQDFTDLRAVGAAYAEALAWTQTIATRIG
jgi:EAL and modified HD-GYP domain-containing signal transduction protein